MNRVIVSCTYSDARGQYYDKYADRLEASLDQFAPGVDRIIWRKSWPPQSPSHGELHYGFKWYAVNDVVQKGYRYVTWLDAGCCAIAPIESIFQRIERDGYALLAGADTLGHWISDQALNHFGVSREHAMGLQLAGGCLVGLNMQHPTAKKFFAQWEELTKKTKLFMCHHTEHSSENGVMRSILRSDADNAIISSDPRVKGHRSDEACFSLMMDQLAMKPMELTEWLTMMKTY